MTSQPEIQAALECGDFTGRNAICSLPMNVYQLRSLNIPPGSDDERRTIIADELAELDNAARARIAQRLHAEPDKAADVNYERMHTGFARIVTVTADDVARVK